MLATRAGASADLPGLELTAADQAFRDEFRGWLYDHLTPRFAAAAGRGGPGDDDGWDLRLAWERELAGGGWIGLSWPRAYGGREATATQEVLFHLEYAAAGAPARCTHFGEALLAPTLLARGSDDLKRRFLPPIARGEELWCQGYSEPGAGSDLAAVQTRARAEGDDWVVDGQKVWTTFAHHADWVFALCRTEPGSRGRAGLSYLLIPLDQPGVDVRPIRSLTGAADFNEIFFDGARTPLANVVGAPGDGWRVAMSTLGHERATSVLAYQFSFVAEFEHLVAAVRARGLAGDPSVRRRLAGSWTGLEVLRLNNARMLTGMLRDGTLGPEASFTKLYWSRWHQEFCELAMDLLGAEATVLAHPDDDPDGGADSGAGDGYRPAGAVRTWLTSRSETIYAGTTEIQLNIIGERVLGLPKDTAPREERSWSST